MSTSIGRGRLARSWRDHIGPLPRAVVVVAAAGLAILAAGRAVATPDPGVVRTDVPTGSVHVPVTLVASPPPVALSTSVTAVSTTTRPAATPVRVVAARQASSSPPTPATTAAPVFGVVGATSAYFAQEHQAGLTSATLSSVWRLAEPAPGVFNQTYLASVARAITSARANTMQVILDVGLQYAPDWVFAMPGGTRFTDQYGDTFTGLPGSGDHVANAVTDQSVRAAESTYLQALAAALPLSRIWGVRVGGGPDGELRYPGKDYNGHADCFWAYDTSTQSASAVPGWVPGTGTTSQASVFLRQYNANLVTFAAWLDATTAAAFPGTKQVVLLPGWGERPGVASAEISTRLTLGYDEFSQGLDWASLLPALPGRSSLVAYTTYLDAPSFSATLQREDPADYIATVAQPLGIALGGENTGGGSSSALSTIVNRALNLRMVVVNWMDEGAVVAASSGQGPAGAPTFVDLTAAASRLAGTQPR